ncbi:hypothetical protein PILCRDRAFT_81365, partial [Piloderma croceum F 1598]
IKLTTAEIVVLYDSIHNPAMDLRHHIGRTKQVCVLRLFTENSSSRSIWSSVLSVAQCNASIDLQPIVGVLLHPALFHSAKSLEIITCIRN